MIHSEAVRKQLAEAIAAELRGGTLEVTGAEGEEKVSAFFSLVEVTGETAHAILKSAQAKTDLTPKAFRCVNRAGEVVLAGTAGEGGEVALPSLVKKGAVITFKFNYRAPQ